MSMVIKGRMLSVLACAMFLQAASAPAQTPSPSEGEGRGGEVRPFRLAEVKESAKPTDEDKKKFSLSSKEESDKKRERGWSPGDSVAIRYFAADPGRGLMWSPQGDPRPIVHSPDGRYFFFVTFSGDLQRDEIVYRLQVFGRQPATSGGRAVAEALVRFRDRSEIPGPAGLTDARWEPGGRAVLFRAALQEGKFEGYRLDLKTGQLSRLTETQHGVSWFEHRGGRLLFRAKSPPAPPASMRYPMEAVTRLQNGIVIPPGLRVANEVAPSPVYVSQGLSSHSFEVDFVDSASIAPNGQFALVYQVFENRYSLMRFSPSGSPSVVNTIYGGLRPVALSGFFWSSDSRYAIFADAKIGLSSGARCIAVLDVSDLKLTCLEPLPQESVVKDLEWFEADGQLTLKLTQHGTERFVAYRYARGLWVRGGDARRAQRANLERRVRVEQSMNDPPELVVDGDRTRKILPADPALRGVRHTEVTRFFWRDYNGTQREGGLLWPAGTPFGNAVPLVIQTYYYEPHVFHPDGPDSTVGAAQALAAKGIAVLQIQTSDLQTFSDLVDGRSRPWEEGRNVVRRIESAVDALVERRITRPDWIGLTGFSRSGYQSYYVATHPERTRFAAIVVADAFTGSYPSYLQDMALRKNPTSYMAVGRSFWEAKSSWLEIENTFNVDRVSSPVLFSESGAVQFSPSYSPTSLQTIGAFVANRRPVEYLYFPIGKHLLGRPLERVAMMSSVVDWLSFWLRGEEDPDPAKATQYRRWRALREESLDSQPKTKALGQVGFITAFPSGVKYMIQSRTTAPAPVDGDLVTLNYVGTTLSGKEIANSYKNGSPAILTMGQVGQSIDAVPRTALEVVLRVMHRGERAIFVVGPSVDGGFEHMPASSGSEGEAIRYEVELVDVGRAHSNSAGAR